MVIDSKFTKTFMSNSLTASKYNEIYKFAVVLREFKNQISNEVNENLLFFLGMNKFTFITYMRETHNKEISSNFDGQLYSQIFTCYQNKFDAIQTKLKFNYVKFNYFEFYKKKTKYKKKDDFKKVNITKKETKLSSCLTYLARYGNINTLEYINNQINNGVLNESKIKMYNNILYFINKFGFARLMNLAIQKRTRIIKRYSEYSIEFKSLSFSGRSRKKVLIDYNKNYNSVINSFISLSWNDGEIMDIPTKFSKDYHGTMKEYEKSNPDYEYVLTFDEKHKEVRINICKDGEREIPENKINYVGLDVNVKHNLFSLSNGDTYDYDRKLVEDFTKLCTEIDELKKNKEYKVGKRKQLKLDKLRLKMKCSNQQLISDMCKDLNNQGIDHIVMEDLNNGFGKSYVKDKNNNEINFNRVVSYLNISSLKQEVEHIARNYDISVSTVQACYTSKMCPICGCIEDENRSSQEEFKCINCGHADNADHNAAINIKNRVGETVFCITLLNKLDNGSFKPKKLKREKVKKVLLSYRKATKVVVNHI